MKRFLYPLLALVAVGVALAASWLFLQRAFPGAAGVVTIDRRALAPFTRIAVEGTADVILVQGASDGVSVEFPARLQPQVRTEVVDGTLTISVHDPRRWWSAVLGGRMRTAKVTVTFRELAGVRAAGAIKLRTDGLRADGLAIAVSGAGKLDLAGLDVRELSVSGSGAMKAELAGRATEQKIAISGAGDFRGAALASERASVKVSGAGRVVVNAAKALDVSLSGAGSVEYLGNPVLTQHVSGAGRVRRRDATTDPTMGSVASAAATSVSAAPPLPPVSSPA